MKAIDMIWLAVDVPTPEKADMLIYRMAQLGMRKFKLGLELLSANGRDILHQKIVDFYKELEFFWDVKLDDIPNTVGKASKVISDRGVAMFNVHASAGRKAIEAAVANKGKSKVAAVTLLTSISQEDLRDLGYPSSTSKDVVVRAMASCAAECKADAIIGSAQEASLIRGVFPKGMIITPAIRPLWAAVGDQKRPTTPADAIKAGATDLVIGRPITDPPSEIGSPAEALKRIVDEMEQAMVA